MIKKVNEFFRLEFLDLENSCEGPIVKLEEDSIARINDYQTSTSITYHNVSHELNFSLNFMEQCLQMLSNFRSHFQIPKSFSNLEIPFSIV